MDSRLSWEMADGEAAGVISGAAVDQAMCWTGADVVAVCGLVSGSAVGVEGWGAEGAEGLGSGTS